MKSFHSFTFEYGKKTTRRRCEFLFLHCSIYIFFTTSLLSHFSFFLTHTESLYIFMSTIQFSFLVQCIFLRFFPFNRIWSNISRVFFLTFTIPKLSIFVDSVWEGIDHALSLMCCWRWNIDRKQLAQTHILTDSYSFAGMSNIVWM